MLKITHTTLNYTDLSKLNEIPSEFIEPYLVAYQSMLIEFVALEYYTPKEAKNKFEAIEDFVSLFGGIHSRLATQNAYYRFDNIPDGKMVEFCKGICKNSIA